MGAEGFFPAGPHGGDGARLARRLGVAAADVLDLSASLNPVAPDLIPLLTRHLDAVGRYPDSGEATEALADVLAVAPDRVLLTNGAAEAIALVAAELGSGRIDEPEFSLYRRHLPLVDDAAPRWRSNPHNPSGRLAAPDEQAAVWDEAFYPLATGEWSRRDPGAVVIGSLTKLFACPGLRLGWVVTPDDALTDRLRARQPAWPVNALASAILPELLALADLPGWAKAVAELRDQLVTVLQAHGLDPQPSDANWVLVPTADGLRDRLARQGVLVRDCASFGLPNTVRIAVPADAGLTRLANALSHSEPQS